MNILMSLERDNDRMEEIAKNYSTFGELTFHKYAEKIDLVTSEDVNRVSTNFINALPTLIVSGSGINTVPSGRDIQK